MSICSCIKTFIEYTYDVNKSVIYIDDIIDITNFLIFIFIWFVLQCWDFYLSFVFNKKSFNTHIIYIIPLYILFSSRTGVYYWLIEGMNERRNIYKIDSSYIVFFAFYIALYQLWCLHAVRLWYALMGDMKERVSECWMFHCFKYRLWVRTILLSSFYLR